MAAVQLIRVDNKEPRLRLFPADRVAKVPAIRLGPGGNNVPASAVAALEAGKAKRGACAGWAKAKASGAIVVHSLADSAVLTKRPEGVTAPSSLKDRNTKAALAIVKVTSDVEVLAMWAGKESHRPKVAEAIAARLAELGLD